MKLLWHEHEKWVQEKGSFNWKIITERKKIQDLELTTFERGPRYNLLEKGKFIASYLREIKSQELKEII